jgi:hypothetical protein
VILLYTEREISPLSLPSYSICIIRNVYVLLRRQLLMLSKLRFDSLG